MRRLILGLVVLCGLATGASADPRYLNIWPSAGPIPGEFKEFCEQYPRECRPLGDPMRVSAEKWKPILLATNRRINKNLTPIPDNGSVGNWRVGNDPADCITYAITKRAELIRAGIPRAAMRLALIDLEPYDHLVLVVSTTDGDRVLDSVTNTIWTPEGTGYRFLSVQDTKNPRHWLRVGG